MSEDRVAGHTYRRQLGTVWIVTALAGVAAAFAPAAPTGLAGPDIVWKALFAASMTLFAAFADRWTWVVVAALASAFAVGGDPAGMAFGFASLAVAILGAARRQRSPIVGAVAVGIASQGLLRLPDAVSLTAASAVVATTAWIVVAISAWSRVGRPVRRQVRRVGFWAAVGLVVMLIPVGITAVITFRESGKAVDESQAWLDAARQGDQPAVIQHLDTARASFDQVESASGGWWNWPARTVPIVGRQLETVNLVASSGRDITSSASTAAHVATVEDLHFHEGQIDLPTLESLRDPLHETSDELARTKQRMDGNDDTWLLPSVRSRVDDFYAQVSEASHDTALAADTLDVAPAMLGGNGRRTYVVLFASPAESRELGGFVGNVGILDADNGKLELEQVSRVRELNAATAALPPDRLLEILASGYPERYLRYTPWVFWQNVTGTPDFPTVGKMVHDLAPDALGRPIDGVVYVDPEGLAALLKVTRPVNIDGLAPIGTDNAAAFLLRDQYVQFPNVDERADFLERVARKTFQRLTSVRLPGPRFIAESLGPAVEGGHLRVWTADPGEQAFFDRLDAGGSLRPTADGDDVLVTVSNDNPNKIDAYLRRTVDYDVTYDDAAGEASGTITVELRNDATVSLPKYVVGNDTPDPRGYNRTFLSLYTGLTVEGATLDGEPLPLELHDEYGLRRAGAFVSVAPQGSVRVVYRIRGHVSVTDRYHLRVLTPALANPDQVRVTLRTAAGVVGSPDYRGPGSATPADLGPGTAAFELLGQADLDFALPP